MNNQSSNPAVIVGYARTPFAKASTGKKVGLLADVSPIDLQVPLINTLINQSGVQPDHVKAVLSGCVHQEGSQGLNIARLSIMHPECDLPDNITGTSVDMFCASSLRAIEMADGLLARNPDAIYIATGVQSMSQVPMGGFNVLPHPALNRDEQIAAGYLTNYLHMPSTAENLAIQYGITREEQDRFAMRSHKAHVIANDAGRFAEEIVPIKGLDHDNGVRPDTSMQGLAKLGPVTMEAGTITGGNSSQITDGASAVMLASESYALENNLPVLARILAFGESGCAPEIMGIGPVEATKDALNKAGLSMKDMGRIELNEAFAAQSLAVLKEWEKQGMAADINKVNVNGGAIAMGHPLGATGARLAGTLALELKKANEQYGLATLCIGGGMGMAMILENPEFTPEV